MYYSIIGFNMFSYKNTTYIDIQNYAKAIRCIFLKKKYLISFIFCVVVMLL